MAEVCAASSGDAEMEDFRADGSAEPDHPEGAMYPPGAARTAGSLAGEPKVRTLPIPTSMPAPHIVEQHNHTHLPHADWCAVCVAARAKEAGHRPQRDDRREAEEQELSQVQLDYTFATEPTAEGTATITILTMRVRTSGWSAATPVPSKGA
eukprot:641800-Amphidinium_carterae.1